jgi:hypothetical protein
MQETKQSLNQRMAKDCIFCGKPADSGEHVWSDALADDLRPLWQQVYGEKSFTFVQDASTNFEKKAFWHGGPLFTLEVACVCTPCNNGWMSRMEMRSQLKIKQFIRGEWPALSRSDIQHLASWIALKTIITEQRHPTNAALSNAHHVNFYLTGLPPEGMEIWIARTDDLRAGVGLWRQGVSAYDRAGGVVRHRIMMLGLGGVVAFIEYNSAGAPNVMPVEYQAASQLWPPGTFGLPAGVLSFADVEKLAGRLNPQFDREAPPRPTGPPAR